MSYGIVHQFKGGTKEQYDAVLKEVHPDGGGLPEGQLFHAAGPSDDGWVVFAVHDSKGSWESFRDSTLLPTMQKGVDGGFAGPPDSETGFEVANELRG